MALSMFDPYGYTCYGIILPIIILFGIPSNVIALCVLHHRFLKNSPVCLLKVLVLHGIATMCFSLYLEVVPTIEMYFEKNDFTFDYSDYMYDDGNYSLVFHPISMNETHHSNSTAETGKRILDLNNTDVEPINYTSLFNEYEDYPIPSNEDHHRDSVSIIKGHSITNFISHNLIHIGLLVTLMLAIERCVAVMFPLRARQCLTTGRTRTLVITSLLLCVIIHLPELIKELTVIDNCFSVNETDLTEIMAIIQPIRKEYKHFFAYSSIVACVLTFALNLLLLIKLYMIKKALRISRHSQVAQRNEINISVAIAVLVFFQLPFHILSTVIKQLSNQFLSDNLKHLVRLVATTRVLYIAHSALNFIIYCLLAKNCRHVLSLMLKRISKRVSVSSPRHENSIPLLNKSNCATALRDISRENVSTPLTKISSKPSQTSLITLRTRQSI